ncbi:MAG: glycolate oxidase binding subunit [Rhodospirillaceae bacterium]|jgi:glycolate oxidase FAD binding subunit|nr:glycolate oxidase binding subunit [Rhodospirillaceae bacterium]
MGEVVTIDRLQPATAEELAASIAAGEGSFEILGHGSKRGFGRPGHGLRPIDLSRFSGIALYEPEELVLTARAGTPISEIESVLASAGQMLAFEPPDLGPLYGRPAGQGTIAGMLACNLAGPRRVKAGAARDYFLGATAVNGRGEIFKTGGRVVKNVTGYDLCKLFAGSFGTLAVLSEATIKVQPRPEATLSLAIRGLDDASAVVAMSKALGSPQEVAAAAHLPREIVRRTPANAADAALTLLRLEGTAASLGGRLTALARELEVPAEELGMEDSLALWRALRDVAPFQADQDSLVWRLSVPPTAGATVVAALAHELGGGGRHFYDWGGGLIWLALSGDADVDAAQQAAGVRAAITALGGHATLIRAPAQVRESVDVFQPQDAALAALTRRVKLSFDPLGRLNPGRMYREI